MNDLLSRIPLRRTRRRRRIDVGPRGHRSAAMKIDGASSACRIARDSCAEASFPVLLAVPRTSGASRRMDMRAFIAVNYGTRNELVNNADFTLRPRPIPAVQLNALKATSSEIEYRCTCVERDIPSRWYENIAHSRRQKYSPLSSLTLHASGVMRVTIISLGILTYFPHT